MMFKRMSNQFTKELICIHQESKAMRGVALLRLLVLLGLVCLVFGIISIEMDSGKVHSEDVTEPDVNTFEDESAADSENAPEGADFTPEQTTPVENDGFNRGPLLVLIGGSLLSSLFIGSLFFEFLRVLFIVAFLTPLIVNKKQDNERIRGRILGFIEANAGIHFSALRDGLGLANGVTAYHLQILEKEETVLSWRDGKLRRYAVSTIGPNEIESIKSPLVGTRLAILQVLSQSKTLGLTGKEIRAQLEISRQLLSHHLRVLNRNGLIEKSSSSRKASWKISRDGIQALQVFV